MKLLYTLLLFLPIAFVSADTSKVNLTETTNTAEFKKFRNKAMDALDNPYCRTRFKNYLKKKEPKAFLFVPRKKERTAFCTLVALKTSTDDASKMVIDRCEMKKKKSRKNKFTAPCRVFAVNNDLLLSRADFDLKPKTKDIFYVAERYGVDEVKPFIDKGIDINKKNKLGSTPLHIAVKENNLDIVKYLISQDADLKLTNKRGENAFIIATKENYYDIFDHLLSKGADIATTDPLNGRQAIHIAARFGHIGMLEELLQKGIDVNQASINNEMPLHLAVQSLYVPTVKYLVKKGANINAIDRSGKTPLDSARRFGSKRMISFLVKKGAKTADSL